MISLNKWAVITDTQRLCSNHFLLLICQETIRITKKKSVRDRRNEQYREFCSSIGIEPTEVWNINKIAEKWWNEESKTCPRTNDQTWYKLLMMFSKNHIACPFTYKEKSWILRKQSTKLDNQNFEEASQTMMNSFILDGTFDFNEKMSPFSVLNSSIQKLRVLAEEKLNLDKDIFSARYELLERDSTLLKGALKTAIAGGTAFFIGGPILGGIIGKLAGFHGAAAVSYGLAFLGGGSLAAGGFGMAGGSLLVSLGAGTYSGFKNLRPGEIDMLALVQAEVNLPIYLAIGKAFNLYFDPKVAEQIRSLIMESHEEIKLRLNEIEEKEKEKDRVKSLETTLALYEKAIEMSEAYDWSSSYDFYRSLKEVI